MSITSILTSIRNVFHHPSPPPPTETPMPDNAKLADLTAKLGAANQQITVLTATVDTAKQAAAAALAQEQTALAAQKAAEDALAAEQQKSAALQAQLDALPDQPTIDAAETAMQQTITGVTPAAPAAAPTS